MILNGSLKRNQNKTALYPPADIDPNPVPTKALFDFKEEAQQQQITKGDETAYLP